MAKIAEIRLGPTDNPGAIALSLDQIIRKINEIVRAVNSLPEEE